MDVGSVVYRVSGGPTAGVIMESSVQTEGLVSVLWESSDECQLTPISELTLHQRAITPTGSPIGGSRSSSLSLKDKMQIISSMGSPDDQKHFISPDMLDQLNAEQLQEIENMADQALSGLGLKAANSSTSMETLRAKLEMLGDDDPRMLDMARDEKLAGMSSDQIATVEAMVDQALAARGMALTGSEEGDDTGPNSKNIFTDLPESSILKYFGTRPNGVRFAR